MLQAPQVFLVYKALKDLKAFKVYKDQQVLLVVKEQMGFKVHRGLQVVKGLMV